MPSDPQTQQSLDAYASGLLVVYQVERQDQQTSGNQSRALIGTGLAYAAGAAALLNSASSDGGQVDPLLVMAAPLPLVALISLLILSVGNVQQRAKYLVRLEEELEPYMSRQPASGTRYYALTVPNGFRRSQYVFAPPGRNAEHDPGPGDAASARLRKVGSVAMGALTSGAMLIVQIGLVAYAIQLTDGWRALVTASVYGLCIGLQVVGWYIALRPAVWEHDAQPTSSQPSHGAG